ncbi:MAG: mechanosensitive ion channel domain-containing protein, partial [archaeon]
VRKITRIIFITLGSVLALSTIGVEISGLLAVTSVGVLILGLASQESLANIFAGLVLQLDRPAAYGDYIRTLNGDILRLQKIGSRSTRLTDVEGNTVVMSNSEFAKQRLTNLSNLRTGFHTTLTAEIPNKIPVSQIEGVLTQFFQKESAKKTATRANPVIVEKIAKDSYVVSIALAVKDAENFLSIRDQLNRLLAEEIRTSLSTPSKDK